MVDGKGLPNPRRLTWQKLKYQAGEKPAIIITQMLNEGSSLECLECGKVIYYE